jgi:hypothetical protein
MSPVSRTMQIFVRVATGRTLVLDVEPWFTGRDVKAMIWWREGIPVEFVWLATGTRPICNGERLDDRNVGSDTTLWANIRGGGVSVENRLVE